MADGVGFHNAREYFEPLEKSTTKNVIEMAFTVLREYARAKCKLINELENLPPAEIVRYFCCSYQ